MGGGVGEGETRRDISIGQGRVATRQVIEPRDRGKSTTTTLRTELKCQLSPGACKATELDLLPPLMRGTYPLTL
jgi:hypothetical protein